LQLSHTSVSIAPADYASWHDVRTELMAEAKTGFKARVESELAAGELQPLGAALNHAANPNPYATSGRREPLGAQGRLPAGEGAAHARHTHAPGPGPGPQPPFPPPVDWFRRSARSSTKSTTRSTRFRHPSTCPTISWAI